MASFYLANWPITIAFAVDGDSVNMLSASGLIYQMRLRNEADCTRLKGRLQDVWKSTSEILVQSSSGSAELPEVLQVRLVVMCLES
jgi:hypothetical protein